MHWMRWWICKCMFRILFIADWVARFALPSPSFVGCDLFINGLNSKIRFLTFTKVDEKHASSRYISTDWDGLIQHIPIVRARFSLSPLISQYEIIITIFMVATRAIIFAIIHLCKWWVSVSVCTAHARMLPRKAIYHVQWCCKVCNISSSLFAHSTAVNSTDLININEFMYEVHSAGVFTPNQMQYVGTLSLSLWSYASCVAYAYGQMKFSGTSLLLFVVLNQDACLHACYICASKCNEIVLSLYLVIHSTFI